mgnify:CR=1 FL=1
MSAPSMFCGKHPVGSPCPCEGCESARRAHREWIADQCRARLASVGCDRERGVLGEVQGDMPSAGEVEPECGRPVLPDVVEVRVDDRPVQLAVNTKRRVYSTRGAAEYCGMPYGTFRDRIAAGTGPTQHKDGDSNAFFEADLDAWNEARLSVVDRGESEAAA